MEIISPFHDYYDFVGHVHGRDTLHTYVRRHFENPNPPTSVSFRDAFFADVKVPLGLAKIGKLKTTHRWYEREPDLSTKDGDRELTQKEINTRARRLQQYQTQWIAVAGNLYPVFGHDGLNSPLEKATLQQKRGVWPEDEPKAFTLLTPDHPMWELLTEESRIRNTSVFSPPGLIELHRSLNAPVFRVLGYRSASNPRMHTQEHTSYSIAFRLPILQEHGFADVVDPYQLYQDLEYFIANTMNESPDVMPVSEMTDKQKIVAAGFDLKQSFRHRKG